MRVSVTRWGILFPFAVIPLFFAAHTEALKPIGVPLFYILMFLFFYFGCCWDDEDQKIQAANDNSAIVDDEFSPEIYERIKMMRKLGLSIEAMAFHADSSPDKVQARLGLIQTD